MMIRRNYLVLATLLVAGCSGGGGGGDQLDKDVIVRDLSGPTTETGGTATFTLVLRAQPSSDVILALTSDDVGEGVVSPESMTFTSFNWNAPQTVTVTGQNDPVDDGNAVFHIQVDTSQTNDGDYAAVQVAPIPVTNLDDESAGIRVSSITGPVTESGSVAKLTISLSAQPAADVVIPVTSSDITEGTVTSQITFTPAAWTTSQEISITGVNDSLADGDVEFDVELGAAVSDDPIYSGLTAIAPVVTVINLDDETAGVTAVVSDAATSENATGNTGTLLVKLRCQPAFSVTATIDVSDDTEAMLSSTSIVFTTANWNTNQTIVVTGLDDSVTDGNQPFTVDFEPLLSNDPAYDNMMVPSVAFTNVDNELAGITVSPLVGVTSELGQQHTFYVVLSAEPSDDVVIPLASTDPSEGAASVSELTFTPMNWNVPQPVTVTGQFDSKQDGNRRYFVQFAPAETNDPVYAGLRAQRVNMTNTDDGGLPRLLVWNDAGGTQIDEAAAQPGETPTPSALATVTTVADAAALDTAIDAGNFDALVLELSTATLPLGTIDRIGVWVSNGGSAIVSYHDLDGSPELQAVLGVSASAPHTTYRNVFRAPGASPNLFDYHETLATLITGSDVVADNGHQLTLTGAGVLSARFDSTTGPGAVAVTRNGRVIVNGFAPDDMDGVHDVDGDAKLDIRELYENELRYLGRAADPVRVDVDTPVAVPDASETTSTVMVSGIPEGITTVRLSLHAIHTDVTDLEFELIAPDGTLIAVSSDNGSATGDDLGSGCEDSERVVFDDAALDAITSAAAEDAPYVQSWRPEQAFSNLLGLDPNGTWTLVMRDDGAVDVGTVECWSLFVQY